MAEASIPSDGGDLEEHEHVMSEVHLGCPPGLSGPHISRFTFSIPPQEAESVRRRHGEAVSTQKKMELDEDGDLVVKRRNRLSNRSCLTIQHNITSSIPNVGLQVWKAELVLSDFVLHKIHTSSEFQGIVSLELGAGTGMVGIILAHVAKTVFITDHGDEILDNCAKNILFNSEMLNYQASVYVRELNWKNPWPPALDLESSESKRFSWTSSEIEEVHGASLLIAADVIYSDDLTDAFFSTLERLMSQGPEKVLYLALEKRYNFSLDDLDVVANGYSRFQSYLRDAEGCGGPELEPLPCFVGQPLDLTHIPQYIREYNRGDDIEIWQIKYVRRKSQSQTLG